MESTALIGPSIRIKGELSAREPLVIAGHVDGSVEVEGHQVTIVESGNVTATVQADTIVVAGTVNGILNAASRIIVRATAVIEGDLSAPSVSLADGATVHGRVETSKRTGKAKLQLAS
jgi:cytoskeletal protein CcmA (bactofilin family)